jgi:hypothetical protein
VSSYSDGSNNYRFAAARVSGETNPVPEFEVVSPDFASLALTAGTTGMIPVRFRNPSLAGLSDIPVSFFMDDELLPLSFPLPPNSDTDGQSIFTARLFLAPGQETTLTPMWNPLTPGQHMLTVKAELPEEFPERLFQSSTNIPVTIPGRTVLYQIPSLDK